jgi:uncharacterized protein YbjT (DUF2867 family)
VKEKSMTANRRVLLVGATGRTGRRVLTALLERDVPVRAIVRSGARLPADVVDHPRLEVVEADPISMATHELAAHVDGCDTLISCLGHTITARGLFGPPRDLVTRAVRRLHGAVRERPRDAPVRLILMSSVSVNRPERADVRRSRGERAQLAVLRTLLPPARDNQRAADYLVERVGRNDPHLQWVVVRPDTLIEGDDDAFAVHEGLVASLRRPDRTRMAQVAHFMCDLVTDDSTWERWRGQMPVLVDATLDRTHR